MLFSLIVRLGAKIINPCLSLLFPVALRHVALDSSLLSAHELRVDALRGILSSHSPRFRLHIGTEAREMADSFRVECTGARFNTLRIAEGICERRS